MKKIVLFAICLLIFQLYAVDFKTIEKSELFVSSGTKRVYSNDILEGEKLSENGTAIFYSISNWDYAVKVKYNYANYFTNLENLIPFQDSDLFSEDILTSAKENQNRKWISKTYLDLITKNDREIIKKIQPYGYKNYEKAKTEYDVNYIELISDIQTQEIFNILINIKDIFNSCNLYIEKIEKTNNGYKVFTKVSDWYMHDSTLKYNVGDTLPLNIVLDGDYLYIKYENNEILTTFVLIDKQTFNEIELFMKTNVCNIKKITWPLHADGTCDYDGSSKKVTTAKTSQPKTSEAIKNRMQDYDASKSVSWDSIREE